MDGVSIHAFRGEGDFHFYRKSGVIPNVSIHAFRGEGDCTRPVSGWICARFQSTPSGGKATTATQWCARTTHCFNPRLPGGRRPSRRSTRARRSGFQSTPSGGKATAAADAYRNRSSVSIHAFRGEGDVDTRAQSPRSRRFNPRLPGGRRLPQRRLGARGAVVSIHAFRGEGDQTVCDVAVDEGEFQSTPSGGKATSISASSARAR